MTMQLTTHRIIFVSPENPKNALLLDMSVISSVEGKVSFWLVRKRGF